MDFDSYVFILKIYIYIQWLWKEEEEKIDSMLPVVIAMVGAIIAGAWCMHQGSTINASVSVEGKGNNLWGSLLTLIGSSLILVGIFIIPIMLIEQVPTPAIFVSAVLSMLLILGVASSAKSDGDEEGVRKALGKLGSLGNMMVVTILISFVFLMAPKIGGESGIMIPEMVWQPLLGCIVMVAGLATASLCIMADVKSGSEMLIANEGLYIWALLFVALGEGLAIYGLIVAILLIG